MKGWVYIITNKSMPELLKVGFSTKDPELRAEELHTTGVPHRFVVEYDVLVNEPYEIEQKAHVLLKAYHENKEWFRCDIATAIIAIRQAANGSIILENNKKEIELEIEKKNREKIDQEKNNEEESKAQFNLGCAYEYGKGREKDEVKAAACYLNAAKQGHAGAQATLAQNYYLGKCGVVSDKKQASYWDHKAAEQGIVQSQVFLFMDYQCAYSTSKAAGKEDAAAKYNSQAMEWARKAAEQGDARAQSYLGEKYKYGTFITGVMQDKAQSLYWYRKAAEQGDELAQRMVGSMYENGEGINKDETQAVYWYRKAAERGDAEAQNNLGVMYEIGKGIAKDEDQAIFWYHKAAAKGNTSAVTAEKRLIEKKDQEKKIEEERRIKLELEKKIRLGIVVCPNCKKEVIPKQESKLFFGYKKVCPNCRHTISSN